MTATATPTTDQGRGAAGATPPASRLRPADVLRVGSSGPRARRARTALSALGVSIGIAALVGVLGLSESSRAALLDRIEALGTNLLTVEAGGGVGTGDGALPATAVPMLERIPTVERVAAVWDVDVDVHRNDLVPVGETGGVHVVAVDADLLDTLNGSVADGAWFTPDGGDYPVAAVGSVAAERLGVRDLDRPTYVQIGGDLVEVVAVLDELPLAADLDRAVLLPVDAAVAHYDLGESPSAIHTRVADGAVDETREVVPAAADPEDPGEVTVSRPSDALEAQAAADDTLTTLFLGLGAVALLVGGVGIANVMIIAVIERRGEIGLRRALGATRAHIRWQFLTEAMILSLLGGVAGVAIGSVATALYAFSQGWRIVIPAEAAVGGLIAAVVIGAVAGLHPASRAARLSPTDALRS